jgi:PPOX class probable F420-dependent enzyme
MATTLSAETLRYLDAHRVGHLATADADGRPHLVPLCYAATAEAIVFIVDRKPKRAGGTRLKRMRNILANPHVAVLVDDYDEDWRRLAYVLVQGRAEILAAGGPAYDAALARLRARYPQYAGVAFVPAENPVVRITPERVHAWRGA